MILSPLLMLNPPDPPDLAPNCRKVFGNFDGQISCNNDESNKPMKTPIRFLFMVLCAAIVSLPSVHAATITVNSTADPTESGKTTLRDALEAVSDDDSINFSVTTLPA